MRPAKSHRDAVFSFSSLRKDRLFSRACFRSIPEVINLRTSREREVSYLTETRGARSSAVVYLVHSVVLTILYVGVRLRQENNNAIIIEELENIRWYSSLDLSLIPLVSFMSLYRMLYCRNKISLHIDLLYFVLSIRV